MERWSLSDLWVFKSRQKSRSKLRLVMPSRDGAPLVVPSDAISDKRERRVRKMKKRDGKSSGDAPHEV